jgi:hypothetical protein
MNTEPSSQPQLQPQLQPPPLQAAASPPPAVEPFTGPLVMRGLFEGLLRQPAALIARFQHDYREAIGRLALLAAVSAAVFGLVLGAFAGHEQLWAAPLKVMAGLLLAALICFPSLYIFSCLAGSRIGAAQLAACFAAALALGGILLLGFAPAVWIFTQSTDSFGFMGFLAFAAWFVALGFAIGFLRRSLAATGGARPGPLAVWAAIFLLVTLQMTTSLRPILGRSDAFLTSKKKFFLEHWSDTIGRSLESAENKAEKPATAATPEQPAPSSATSDKGRNPYVHE